MAVYRFRLGDPPGVASEAAAISTSELPPAPPDATQTYERRCAIAVWVVALVAVFVRLPAAIHQSGGQDEDYFTVAGWSLLKTGVPRIPYAPSLNKDGYFYKADEILFALPPGFFAAEAAVFKLVGPSYAAGRLTSLLAGAAAIVGVYYLARRWFRASTALFSATLFAFSRPFLFPATTARPDMLCTALLIWSLVVLRTGGTPKGPLRPAGRGSSAVDPINTPGAEDSGVPPHQSPLRTACAGLLAGLALLTHPFALLGVLLAIGWIVFTFRDRKRLHLLSFIAGTAATFALWLPLIAKDPTLFKIQFGNNVLHRAGPGLLTRIGWPFETLWYHAKLFVDLAGPWQAGLFGVALITGTITDLRSNSNRRGWLVMTWAAVLGLAILQGVHPSKGYWSFPAAFLCMVVARCIEVGGRWKPLAVAAALALLVPGGGWKAAAVYLRHWGDPDYSHPETVHLLLDELPEDGRYLVDVGCVFDVHLSGRRTLLALDIPQYYSAAEEPYNLLIVTRTGLDQRVPQAFGASRRIRIFGNPHDDLAVYFEVWVQ